VGTRSRCATGRSRGPGRPRSTWPRSRSCSSATCGGGGATETPTFALAALTRDGRRVTLLKVAGFAAEEALYFEQELERRLRIRDEPVVGEVARDGG
jgi:hypothetical protein